MTTKTPEQIAAAKAAAQSVIDANSLEQEDGENPLAALGWAMGEQIEYEDALIRFAAAAIEADRAQPERDGTIHAAVIKALQDRADSDLDYAAPCERAIKWIERDPDGFWEQHARPMLDEIEADYTRMAREIKEG
jgi:hypothetical protein